MSDLAKLVLQFLETGGSHVCNGKDIMTDAITSWWCSAVDRRSSRTPARDKHDAVGRTLDGYAVLPWRRKAQRAQYSLRSRFGEVGRCVRSQPQAALFATSIVTSPGKPVPCGLHATEKFLRVPSHPAINDRALTAATAADFPKGTIAAQPLRCISQCHTVPPSLASRGQCLFVFET